MTSLAAATVQADAAKLPLLPGLNKVGFGYDVRTQAFVDRQIFLGTSEDEARESDLIATIGDTDYLGPANLTTTTDTQSYEGWAYGRSVQELKNEYLLDTDVQVGYGGYDVEARFSIAETSEQASEHVYATCSERVFLFKLRVIDATRSQLTAQVKDAIDDTSLSPKELFALWGTHVLVSSSMGGAYELNAHFEKSHSFTEQEIKTGMKAKGSSMGIQLSGSVDYDSISSSLREQIDAGCETSHFGGDPTLTSSLDKWRKSIPDYPQPIAMLSLIPLSDLAEGRRMEDLESALQLLLEHGLTGVANFGETIFGPADRSADEWLSFLSPTKFGFVSPEHAGDDALLSFSLPEPTVPDHDTAGWNASGSYFQVKHRDSKDHPDDGKTYEDGRFHYAIVPRASARLVEIVHTPGTDLEQGVVIYPTDLQGVRITDPTAWKRWKLVIAPADIGTSEPGSNWDNALLGYECTATADDAHLQWTVKGTYAYRFNNTGLHETRPAGIVRCLLLENPEDDPQEDLYRTGFVEDGQAIVAPTDSCDDWLLLLSPVRMGRNQDAGDQYAMLRVECTATAGGRSWTVSAKCTARRKGGLNDGDRETVGGRCNYLLIRRPGA